MRFTHKKKVLCLLVVRVLKYNGGNMSGIAAQRGFIVQSIIAMIECLRRNQIRTEDSKR